MPSIDEEPGGLNSDQQRDVRNCASQLKKLLLSGAEFVDLHQLLPPAQAPHRRAILHELIKTELEARYARGQGRLLEEFLRQYPELGSSADLPAGLIYEEYRARWMFGDHPTLDEYRARFPLQFEKVRRLVHRHLPPEASSEAGAPSASRTIGPALTFPADLLLPPTQTGPPSPPPKPSGGGLSPSPPDIEGYQLLERIGRGAYGEVYRARAPGGVIVAVKRIFRSIDDDSSQRELKALDKIRELRHPYLLQTQSFRAFEDRLVIVMELADGSLEDRLKQCRAAGQSGIPTDELLRYFSEAAEALDFLHEGKMSHRDIKPQNLLNLKGHAKVADFGIARPQLTALDHTLNSAGTPQYMPPEMWRGEISVHSDQYSLALTWYEMRTGQRAFSGTSQLDLLQQHATGKPDVAGVPMPEQKVLLRALAKQPDQRFPSCVAFVQALKEAMAAPSTAESLTRRRDLKVAVRALAIAVTTVLIILIISKLAVKPPPRIDWQPRGFVPPQDPEVITDRKDRLYYKRLVRHVVVDGVDLPVVVVAVPQKAQNDPPTFYIMENKVSNDLYAAFLADPKAMQLFKQYKERTGCEPLVGGDDWRRGAFAPQINPNPDKEPFFGVEGEKGSLPVFRVKVTEAHCFAEWLGGLLPTQQQWRKAAGWEEDKERSGPFKGDPLDKTDLAVDLKSGPWPVDKGERDVSIYGCRQMASNGREWTRDLIDSKGEEIPLKVMMLPPPHVYVLGQRYLWGNPLTFRMMDTPGAEDCTKGYFDVTFRIVLEQ